MADRRPRGRTRAQRFRTTIRHAYRMHVQTEFLISSAASDPEVHWAGRAHAAGTVAALAQISGAAPADPTTNVADAAGHLRVPADYRTRYQALGSWAIAADSGQGSKEMHAVYASQARSTATGRR